MTGTARTSRVTLFLEDDEMAKLEELAAAQGVPPGRAAYLIIRRALKRRR